MTTQPRLDGLARRFAFAAGLLALAAAAAAAATVYDLTADWSDTANPNGTWSYCQGASLLPHVEAWQGLSGDFTTAQPAWARFDVGTSNLPCVFRSSANVGIAHDWLTGDVVCHTTDGVNGVGSGIANVRWTSPVTGTVAVSGAIWMGRDIGRGNHWSLALDGTPLTSGDVASGDPYSRAAPMDFAMGTGGAGALSPIAVSAGDVIELDLEKSGTYGDYSVIRMQVQLVPPTDAGPAPVPTALRLDLVTANPQRGAATLRYGLPREAAVALDVYDLRGRRVAALAAGERGAGTHSATWDARVPGGLYFARLRAGGREAACRIVVLR